MIGYLYIDTDERPNELLRNMRSIIEGTNQDAFLVKEGIK